MPVRLTSRGLLFAVVAIGVFWLPYHVPASSSTLSDSAQVGFNNRVAVLAVLAGILIGTVMHLSGPRLRGKTDSTADAGQLGIRPLLIAGTLQTLVILLLHWITQGNSPGESWYFLPRYYDLSRGLAPYQDFEFAYGPAMLYPPVWLQQAFGISIEAAYSLWVWVFCLLGDWILWSLLRQMRAERDIKVAVFACLTLWLPIGMALQFVPLRFLCGFGALSLARAATLRLRHRWFLLPPLYVSLTILVFAVSPEIGCAFVPGLMVYLLLEFGVCREFFGIASMYLLLALCIVRLLPDGEFLVLGGFAAGGNALPVLPSPYLLLYLVTLLAVVPPLLADALNFLRGKHNPDSRPQNGLAIAMAVQVICLIPGALGRSDLGHVFAYGMGAFLLAVACNWPAAKWRLPYWVANFAVFQMAGLLIALHFFLLSYLSAASQTAFRWVEDHQGSAIVHYARARVPETEWNDWTSSQRLVRESRLQAASALEGLGQICVPLGDADAYQFLAPRRTLQPEYYYSLMNVFTADQVRRKISDLRTCKYLLLPGTDSATNSAPARPVRDAAAASFLKWILMSPWIPRLRDPAPPNPYTPFFEATKSEFVFSKQVSPTMSLWVKK